MPASSWDWRAEEAESAENQGGSRRYRGAPLGSGYTVVKGWGMRIGQWVLLAVTVLSAGCSSGSRHLTAARAAEVDKEVRAFAGDVAHGVTHEGPLAWRRYFADSPEFFMAWRGVWHSRMAHPRWRQCRRSRALSSGSSSTGATTYEWIRSRRILPRWPLRTTKPRRGPRASEWRRTDTLRESRSIKGDVGSFAMPIGRRPSPRPRSDSFVQL